MNPRIGARQIDRRAYRDVLLSGAGNTSSEYHAATFDQGVIFCQLYYLCRFPSHVQEAKSGRANRARLEDHSIQNQLLDRCRAKPVFAPSPHDLGI